MRKILVVAVFVAAGCSVDSAEAKTPQASTAVAADDFTVGAWHESAGSSWFCYSIMFYTSDRKPTPHSYGVLNRHGRVWRDAGCFHSLGRCKSFVGDLPMLTRSDYSPTKVSYRIAARCQETPVAFCFERRYRRRTLDSMHCYPDSYLCNKRFIEQKNVDHAQMTGCYPTRRPSLPLHL